MDYLYLLLFAAGLICAVIRVFLGGIFDFPRQRGKRFPFLQPTALATFVTVFGGTGYVLGRSAGAGGWMKALLSFVTAVIASALMVAFVELPKRRAERSAGGSERELIGKTAEVATAIMHGRKGEIVFEHEGAQMSAPAVVAGEEAVRQGDTVRIVGVEKNGTFVVEKAGGEREELLRA